jgi:capsular exopolysaccharide synthesis family protein
MIEKIVRWNPQNGQSQTRTHGITFQEIKKIIKRRKKGILAIIAVSLSASLFIHYLQTPEYQAVSIIMINDTKNPTDLLQALLGPDASLEKDSKKDEELLKSMSIAELTINALNKISKRPPLELMGERQYLSPIAQLVKEITPFDVLNAKQKHLESVDTNEQFRRNTLSLSKRIRVIPVRQTNMLKVSVASPFADEATLLTNTLCQVYKNADVIRRSEKYSQANNYIANMLEDQKKKVDEADNALAMYMTSHEIYEVSGNTQQLLEKLIETEAKTNAITAESHIAKNGLNFLDTKLSETDKSISSRITQNVNTQLGSIMDEIRGRESEYVKVLREKGAEDAEVKAKRQQLELAKTRYEQLSRSKIAGEIGYAGKAQKFNFDVVSEKLQIEKKMNELNFSAMEFSRLKQYYENQLSALPKKQQEYIKLQRDRDVAGKTYIALKEKFDETRIMLGSEVGGVSIIGPAFRPFNPVKPDLPQSIILGLLGGVLLAVTYTVSAESSNVTINDELFFKDMGLRPLGIIPVVDTMGNLMLSRNNALSNKALLLQSGSTYREKLLAPYIKNESIATSEVSTPMITDNLNSIFTESFRMLRTSLDQRELDSPFHSILISGTEMSEGKSTICANLGMAYALIGKKTLIIDCDLRRASQHKRFNCMREPGLTDYLTSEQENIDSLFFQVTHIDNLFLLSAGKRVKNPNELLGSSKMKQLIKNLEEQFDKVLLDCPPVFLSDAVQLVQSVDGIVLASRLNYTTRKPIQEFIEDPFLRSKMIGIAITAYREPGDSGYGRYGYSYDDEES